MITKDMIEIFLFVNPLDENSLEIARSVYRFPDNRSEKVSVRLITHINPKQPLPCKQSKQKSLIFNPSYMSCLAFQAASMQGKKRGSQFFINLQHYLFEEKLELSEDTIIQAALDAKVDLEMFREDLYSDLARKSYQRDKQLAVEMDVYKSPTCIIYYHTDQMNKARVESIINEYTLHYACNTCSKQKQLPQKLLAINPLYLEDR